MARRARPADPCSPEHYTLPDGDEIEIKTADGGVLAASVVGSGPTVVLPHCWTGSRDVWAPVAHRLVDAGRQVVLYDHRGHGGSVAGSDGYGFAPLADDLRAVLEELDVRDAVLAGHSMGGMTVQALAIKHPDVVRERVRRVVFVATAAHGVGVQQAARAAVRVVASPTLDRVMRSRRGARLVRGAVGKVAHPEHVARTRDLFVATSPEARAGFLRAMQTMDMREGLADLPVPATVITASRDTVTPAPLGRALAKAIPGARLVELTHVGHMLPFEAPDDVTAEILRD